MTYIADVLFDVGPVVSTGGGAAPLSHGELRAWMQNTGIELRPWESQLIRRLSREYLATVHEAVRPDYPEPCVEEQLVSERRERAANSVRSALRVFK